MKRIFSVIISVFAMSVCLIPSAIAADTEPPKLVDFSSQTSLLNIAKADASVVARFIISDDSEIVLPNLLLKSISSSQMTTFATVKELSRSGKFVSYEATAVIKFGQSPKVWEWVLYPLKDSLGNTNSLFGPGSAWSTQVSVLNEEYDSNRYYCDLEAKRWNQEVELFLNVEALYLGAPELAIVRLKSKTPVEKMDGEVLCSYQDRENPIDFHQIAQTAVFAMTRRIEAEQAAKQVAAEKAAADKAAADAKAAAAKAAADAKAAAAKAAATKKITITCVKGKLIKKVTAVKPVCPVGYKKK